MKRIHRCSSLLFIFLSLFSLASHARNINELIIVNHFDKPLKFIMGANPEILPDLPATFMLDTNGQTISKVIDIQNEAYLCTEDSEGHSGFWGVDVEDNKTHFHGYISKGMAYSWDAQTITFCTPEEYQQKGACA